MAPLTPAVSQRRVNNMRFSRVSACQLIPNRPVPSSGNGNCFFFFCSRPVVVCVCIHTRYRWFVSILWKKRAGGWIRSMELRWEWILVYLYPCFWGVWMIVMKIFLRWWRWNVYEIEGNKNEIRTSGWRFKKKKEYVKILAARVNPSRSVSYYLFHSRFEFRIIFVSRERTM